MDFKIKILRKYLIVFFIPAIFLSGCGVWEDFTTYFNLYYNTSEKFDEAEKAIYEQKRELFSTDDLTIPGTANQLLTQVIEKASKILQFSSNSSFVDDALLMLGKSFYYQKNYLKGLRKFQELIATQPESGLILETQLWIGKTQMKLKEFEEGLAALNDVRRKAVEEGEDEFVKEAFVEQIRYEISIEDYSNAIETSKEFIKVSGDEEVNAEVIYQVGKLYVKIEDLPNAIESFKSVFNYSPVYEIELRANIELAKALRDSEKPGAALAILEDISSQDKFFEAYSEIDLETGITLISLERYDDAIELLSYVDTSYSNTSFSSVAKFKLAEIYEKHLMNFDSSAVYYQKSISGNTPPEIVMAANVKNKRFRKYQQLHTSLAENKQKLSYLTDPELFIQDSIKYYDSLKSVEGQVPQTDDTEIRNTGVQDTEGENIQGKDTQGEEIVRRPPSTRTRQLQTPTTPGTSIIEMKPPVRPTISEDSLKSLILKSEFELANLFLTEFNLPDSAYNYYSDIIIESPGSEYEGRVLYGIGSYYQITGDNEKADSLFNIIYENFKDEQIVNAAANKLKKPLVDLQFDPAKDLYSEAEKLMLEDNYLESFQKFYNIYLEYPESEFAPKALYTSGWILENELKMYDSAAVVYDSVASQYSKTVYASAVRPKLEVYIREQESKRKAIADSLGAIRDSLAIQDSLNAIQFPVSSDTLKTGRDKFNEPVQVPADDSLLIQKEQPQKTPQDSLQQEHESIIDSLQRSPAPEPDNLLQEVEDKLDSIPPGRIREP